MLSDIHGNLPALEAALTDARSCQPDMYLFLGDYIRDCPWPNEVARLIRGLPNAVVIRGNNEGYLRSMRHEDQATWVHDQYSLIYWNYRALTSENLEYLAALPETAQIEDSGETIRLSHTSSIFHRKPKLRLFHTSGYRALRETKPFSHEEYLKIARAAVIECENAYNEMLALPKGVYLFGHSHLQFHMEMDGRWFINPGSCGISLDFDNTAAYAILERTSGGWRVEERRVTYDVDGTVRRLRASGLHTDAPAWCRIIEQQLLTAKEYMSPFLMHVEETARRLGEQKRPVSNEVWSEAVKNWRMD
ncbi:MAG: metallophosphatase family protein [Oscillospiraceae bacterium]|jgi:predicted phosphodiesterase|nr:metallophosphatase family protein [Oscillospiraceae bacterium]